MRSRGDATSLALPITLVVTAAVAFLPVRWRAGWQRDLSRIVQVPLRPLTFGGSVAADFLAGGGPDAPAISPEQAEVLQEEIERVRQQYAALEAENRELRRDLAEVLAMRGIERTTGQRPLYRDLRRLSRPPMDPDGPWDAMITRWSPSEVLPLPAMVVSKRPLSVVGTVVRREPGERAVQVRPITSRAVGSVRATVHPVAGRTGEAGPEAVLAEIQLEPTGDGAWEADLLEADAGLQPGDRVRVSEPRWPAAVQGYELGRVAAIEPHEEQPLWRRLRVEPVVDLASAGRLGLLADRPTGREEAGVGGEGAGAGGEGAGAASGATPGTDAAAEARP